MSTGLPSGTAPSAPMGSVRSPVASSAVGWGRLFAAFHVLVALTLVLVASSPVEIDSPRTLWGCMMLWVCAFPSLVWASGRGGAIPFHATLGVIYFAYFGLPAFSGDVIVRLTPVFDAQIIPALKFATASMVFLLLGLYCPLGVHVRWRFTLGTLHPNLPPPASTLALLAVVGLFCRALLHLRLVPSPLAQVVLAGAGCVEAGTGLIFLWCLRGHQVPYLARLLAVLTTLSTLLLELGSGLLTAPIKLCIFYLFLYIGTRRRVPWVSMGLALALLLPFLHMKAEFRHHTWEDGRPTTQLVERVEQFVEVTYDALAQEGFTLRDLRDSLQKRLDAVGLLGVVMANTPSTVPYWEGDTYLTLLWAPIPRLIYPDKPSKRLGQEFGHRYGLMAPNDFSTSLNLPQLIELYANFGRVGVLGMLALGLFYRGIQRTVSTPGVSDVGIVFGVLTMVRVLQIESDFSLVFGGLLWNLALTVVLIAGAVRLAQGARLNLPRRVIP